MRIHPTDRKQPWYLFAAGMLCLPLIVGPASADARTRSAPRCAKRVTVAGLEWHTDYAFACREAKCQKRMLLINFVPTSDSDTQESLERWIARNAAARGKLQRFVLVRLPRDIEFGRSNRRTRLIDHPAFEHLEGQPGIVILDFKHVQQSYYGRVVSALPFANGKYYQWQNSHLGVAIDLPPGTISQRTMVWAVRTHPEAPASTIGRQHPAVAEAAAAQSAYQARLGVQGHHRWETRFHQVRAAADAGSASEVVAESWPNQNLIDSCIDCVRSWRHSPGHWRAVRSRQRLFGYDISRGRNGIWYGTGIFAN